MPEANHQTVAAIQMDARVADIHYNLSQAKELIDEAGTKGAKIIALPEFFTTQIIYDERLFECALPSQNIALDLLTEKAAQYSAMIGGSYLEMREGDVYNTYVLVEADGQVHRHDKDLPTMVENAFYIGGRDDGLFQTKEHSIGIAMCWEMIRTQTARRLREKVDLIMAGSHWWGVADLPIFRARKDEWDEGNQRLMHVTPGKLANMVGAPLIHAGHCGPLEGQMLMLPGTRLTSQIKTHLTGETQIIDREGTIVASMGKDEGAGVITANIELGRCEPRLDIPDRFWIPENMGLAKWLWRHQNTCAKPIYKAVKNRGSLKTFSPT